MSAMTDGHVIDDEMAETGGSVCPHCQEAVAPSARSCPHCRNTTLTDLRVLSALADARARYRVARALASLGPAAPAIGAAQAALAGPGVVLRGVLPGIARDAVATLDRHAVSVTLEPASAAAPALER